MMTRLPGSWMMRALPSTRSWRPFCTSSKRRGPGTGGTMRAAGGAPTPPGLDGGGTIAGAGEPTPGLGAGGATLSGEAGVAWPGARLLGGGFGLSGMRPPSLGTAGFSAGGVVCFRTGGWPIGGGGGGGGGANAFGGGGGGAFGGGGAGGTMAGPGGGLGGWGWGWMTLGAGGGPLGGGCGWPFCRSRSRRFFSSSVGCGCAWAASSQPERPATIVPAREVNERDRSRQLPTPSWRPIVMAQVIRVDGGAHSLRAWQPANRSPRRVDRAPIGAAFGARARHGLARLGPRGRQPFVNERLERFS